MRDDDASVSAAQLKAENEKLKSSLERCEALVTQCKERLTAAGEIHSFCYREGSGIGSGQGDDGVGA